MVFGLSKIEQKLFAGMFVFLIIFFVWGLNYISPFLQNNFILSYLIFLLVYSFIVFKYILQIGDPGKQFALFLSFIIVVLVGDILFPPFLVSPTACGTGTDINSNFSSDVLICNLLPKDWNPYVKYLVTYPVAITLGFLVARKLSGRKKFGEIAKEAL